MRRRLALALAVAVLGFGAALGAVVWGLSSNDDAIQAIEREGVERRDATCKLFEREYLANLGAVQDERERLGRTLSFLQDLPADERDTALARAIRESLPNIRRDIGKAERQADATRPPGYCLEPGVGL